MKLTNKSSLIISIIILGLASIVTQVNMMREFLSVFSGNEFIIGIFLASWMILTGTGAYLGRKSKAGIKSLLSSQIILSLIPFLSLATFYIINANYFPTGYSPGPLALWIYILILTAPFCIISGRLFVLFAKSLSNFTGEPVAKAYGLESIGSLAGGILFTFLMLSYLDAFRIMAVVYAMIFLSALIIIARNGKPRLANMLGGPASTLLFIALFINFNESFRQELYPGQDLLESINTRYNKIDITKSGKQFNVYQDHALAYSSNAPKTTEEIVHFSMSSHPEPDSILILGGLISKSFREILKYKPELIVYPELNEKLISIAGNNADKQFDSIVIVSKDYGIFVKRDTTFYDVIIADLPDPYSASLNKYYSKEFFMEIKARLNENGVFIIGLESPGYYLDDESMHLLSVMMNTMKSVFREIDLLASDKNYILAGNSTIYTNPIENISKKNIENKFLSSYYISDDELAFRSRQILESIDKSAGINSNYHPIAYFHRIQYWTRQYGINIHFIFIILITAAFLFFLLLSSVNKGLFVTGFTGASLEFILIIIFQLIFGSIYYYSALLISLFMAGIAAGAIFPVKFAGDRIKKFILIFLVSGIMIPSFIIAMQISGQFTHSYFVFGIILMLMCFAGYLTGLVFSTASWIMIPHQTAARIASGMYGSDLIGASAGILVTSLYIIPFYGIMASCIILAIINLVYLFYMLMIRKKLNAYNG